jgi:hypothetical protein
MVRHYSWRRVKSDFLTHNHKPRLDYLAWILIKRLMPAYDRLLNERLTYTGRHRRLPEWRKAFKREWKRCAVAPLTVREDNKYNPLPYRWVCTCPAFVTSRFLVCKHLVQLVHRVSPRFFQQVSRERSCPIWRHPELIPLAPPQPGDLEELVKSSVTEGTGIDSEMDVLDVDVLDDATSDSSLDSDAEVDRPADSEEIDEEEERMKEIGQKMHDMALQLQDLASVIEYNAQYTDRRALQVFTQKTKATLSLMKNIQKKEKLVRSHTAPNPPTFAPAFAELMFVRMRPRKLTAQL